MADTGNIPQRQFNYGTRTVPPREEYFFKRKLTKAGLIKEEVDFLVHKFVYNRSIREIAKELGFTSKSTAGYFYRKIKQKLKKQGLFVGKKA